MLLRFCLSITLACQAFASEPSGIRYVVSTVAGGNYLGDDGPASAAIFDQPEGLAVDSAGNVYIADSAANRIRRVGANGLVQTVAGTGVGGFAGDGGAATAARVNAPYGLAVDRSDALYIADLMNGRVRRLGTDGVLHTFAGGGSKTPLSGERIPAAELKLVAPRNVAVDGAGGIFISDFGAHRVYRVAPDGFVSLVAGRGTAGFSGDGGLAVESQLNFPCGLAVDRQGVLYVADSANRRVRRVYQGFITSVAELGNTGVNALGLATPTGVALDRNGSLYIADGRPTLIRIAELGQVSTVPASATEVASDNAGALYLTKQGMRFVQRFASNVVTSFAGVASLPDVIGDGAPAIGAQLRTPGLLAIDAQGNIAFADTFSRRVRLIDNKGTIKSVVGSAALPSQDDPVVAQANAVPLARPAGVAWDKQGNLYVSDLGGHRIRRISPNGEARVIAGKPKAGFSGDGASAADAELSAPAGLAVASDGSIYFADSGNNRIRRITASGHIFTVAGGGLGKPGEEGTAVAIGLEEPYGVAVDKDGNVYFTETTGNRVRMLNSAGQLVTLASNLQFPRGIAVDADATLWIADSGAHRVRTLTSSGQLSTVAGTGVEAFGGDGGAAVAADFDTPIGVWPAADGSVYISDSGNHRIRKLLPPPPAAVIEPPPPQSPPPPVVNNSNVTLLHGASLLPTAVAPGMLATLSGQGLGPALPIAGRVVSGRLETQVGGTEVRFDGIPAPLLYVQDKQVNLQVPYGVAGKARTEVTILRAGSVTAQFSVAVQRSAPGILVRNGGSSQAIAVREDGRFNGPDAPVAPGGILTFYITGDGQPGVDGVVAAAADATRSLVMADIGGYAADILYAGKAPGLLGVMQVNARVSPNTRMTGALGLVVRVDGVATQDGVIVHVR